MHTCVRILVVLLLAILAIRPAPAHESGATVIRRVTDTSSVVGRMVSMEEVHNLPIHLGDVDTIIRLGNGVAFINQPASVRGIVNSRP